MLRRIVQAVAGIWFLAALALFVWLPPPAAWTFLGGASLLALGCFAERFYYRGGDVRGVGGHWEATQERFLDEESGRPVTVWFNATTGARRYVEDGAPPP